MRSDILIITFKLYHIKWTEYWKIWTIIMQICLNLTREKYPVQKLCCISYWTEKENINSWNWVILELFSPLQKGYSIFIIYCVIYLNCVSASILCSISQSFLCSFPLWNYKFIQWKWSYLKMAYLIWCFSSNFRFYSDF